MEVWNKKEDRVNGWTAAGLVLLASAVLIGIWIVLAASVWGLRVATAGIYGAGEARIRIQSAEFRIPAYNHFFDLCAGIQGLEAGIDAQEEALEREPSERTRNIIITNIAGLTAERLRSIRQYNADAAKDYTIGQFRDSDLPYVLAATAYEGGNTKCVN